MRFILECLQQLAGLVVFVLGALCMFVAVGGIIISIREPSLSHAVIALVIFVGAWIVTKLGWLLFCEA